jgi:hypothetical protein
MERRKPPARRLRDLLARLGCPDEVAPIDPRRFSREAGKLIAQATDAPVKESETKRETNRTSAAATGLSRCAVGPPGTIARREAMQRKLRLPHRRRRALPSAPSRRHQQFLRSGSRLRDARDRIQGTQTFP